MWNPATEECRARCSLAAPPARAAMSGPSVVSRSTDSAEPSAPGHHIFTLPPGALPDTLEGKSTQQPLQAHKTYLLGELSRGLAHEYNNLLSVIMGYSDMLLNDMDVNGDGKDLAQEIYTASTKAAELIGQMRMLNGGQTEAPPLCRLNDLIEDTEALVRQIIPSDLNFEVMPTEELGSIRAHPAYVRQLLLTLVLNLRGSIPEGGKLTIEASTTSGELLGPWVGASAESDGMASVIISAGTSAAASAFVAKSQTPVVGNKTTNGLLASLCGAQVVYETDAKGEHRYRLAFPSVGEASAPGLSS